MQCKEKGIRPGLNLFPWESFDEEWTIIQCKQFKYQDLDDALVKSEVKLKIDIDCE